MVDEIVENPSRRDFLRLGGVLGLLAGTGFLAFKDLDIFSSENLIRNSNSHFSYSFSPWEKYATLEDKILDEVGVDSSVYPRAGEKAIKFADKIADEVAKMYLEHFKVSDINDIDSDKIDRVSLMKIIADKIDKSSVFYTEESLMSRSFNEDIHLGKQIHLDCDLLSYLMVHIGKKLDVEMNVVRSPNHMYLQVPTSSNSNQSYIIETTDFGNISSGFFSTFEIQKSKVIIDKDFEKINVYNVPLKDENLLEDCIIGNITAGISDYAYEKNDLELLIKNHKVMEQEVSSSSSSIIIDNYFNNSLEISMRLNKNGEFNLADNFIRKAVWIRKNKRDHLSNENPVEFYVAGLNKVKRYDFEGGERIFKGIDDSYYNNELLNDSTGKVYAQNQLHAQILVELADVSLKLKTASTYNIYKKMLIPAINQFSQYEDAEDFPEYIRAVNLAKRIRNR